MPFIVPAIAAVAGFFGATGAVATAIGWAGALAISIGASLAAKAIWGKKPRQTSVGGTEGEVKMGGDVPRQVIFGTAAVAGHLVYINSYGPSNSNEQEVYVLADWECDSLVGIIVDGEEKTLVAQTPIGGEDARFWVNDRDNGNSDTTDDAAHYGSKLEIRFYRGAASQTADAGLVANATPGGRWTTAHRGDGICYVVVDKTYDADLFSGFPTFKFIVKGGKLYDWRKDSTAGGSGSHRWGDPATWEWSGSPAVCLYNYQRGLYRSGKLLLGQGVPSADLIADLYTAAANVCDEAVTLAAGGSEARYAVSAIAVDDVQHRDVMESMVNAMGGWLYERAGSYAPIAGAAQSIVATITDDDLLLDGQVKVSHKLSRAELVNYVSGQFTSPADLWESQGYTAITSSANEAADGERLGKSLDLPQITSQSQAERIALLRYNENRCQTRASVPLSLQRISLEIGDWIRWNSARHGNWVYRISDWGLSLVGTEIGLNLGLSEISAAVYGWNPLVDEGAPITSGTPRIDAALTRSLAGFAVSASSAVSALGEEIPALVVTWTPPADQTVVGVIVEYRRTGEDNASAARSDTPEAGSIEITGLVGGGDYEVRGTIVTDPPRSVTWTTWHAIETTPTSYPLAVDTTDLVPSLEALVSSLGATADDLRATVLREITSRTADRARASNHLARVRSEITETYDAATGALAQRIDTVEAAVDDAAAAVQTEATARATADTALSGRVDTVVAGIGPVQASGAARLVAAADQSGALARYELVVQTETDGTGSDARAAMTIEAVSAGDVNVSQVKFAADRFYVQSADGTAVAPLAVVDGAVYADLLQVRHRITIGAGSGGSLLISD